MKESNKLEPISSPEEQPHPLFLLGKELKQMLRSKKAWAFVGLFLLLLLLSTTVPVSNLPFLRNLVQTMGYSAEETREISFLKALLSWNERAKIQRGELEDPNAIQVFGNDGGGLSAQNRMTEAKNSSLINLRMVNAALIEQGKSADLISGSYHTLGEENEGGKTSSARVRGNYANTQANQTMPSEVFFGEDAGVIARDPKDGFDSVQSLKKIANPHIAGAGNMDWIGKMADKAIRSDSGLQNLTKTLETGGMLSQLDPIMDIGNHKAQRDMYYAWLTGMSARRTPNPVLKKTLASAGFDGAEMPKKVFDSSGFSGIGISPDDVVADLDNIKIRLENEKLCEQAVSSSGTTLTNQLQAAKQGINALAASFPKTCEEVNGTFTDRLSVLRNQCEQVKLAYSDLGTYCGISVRRGREGTCDTSGLQDRYNQYAAYCAEEQKKCEELETPEEQKACLGDIKAAKDYDEGECAEGGCSSDGVSHLVGTTFNVGVNGAPVDPNAADFFPETDWGATKFY